MVIRDGEVAFAAGYGLADLERREPITSQTTFDLASVSKQFTAAAVLILAERGELELDDPMVEHLPELARFGDRITLRHLLTHTSGLPDYYDALEAVAVADGSRPDTAAAMRFLAAWDAPPLFPPGERWEYSNPGYEMLALVVERASRQRFGAFLEESIFRPLGMTGSVVRDNTEPVIAHRARGYTSRDGRFELLDDHPLNHIIGSGSVFSSIEDLARWDRALDTETLVRRSTLEEAWTPVELAGGERYPYGFGWELGDYGGLGRRVHHTGHWLGFSNYLGRLPERRLTVIVLSNIEDFESEEYAGRIVDLLYPTTLIADAAVVDGRGGPAFAADVRIEGERIAAVGELEPAPGEPVVDGRGLVLSPGFIDAHSHADDAILELRDAEAAVNQGITTVVVGQDGESKRPLADFFARLEAAPAAINVASFAGHGTLRTEVMREDYIRAATAAEVERMEALLEEEMAAGALGLSTGLEYDPGIYSTTAEVVALARVAATHGGRYISHVRSEDRRFWEAVDEILTIGREAGLPVQITHVKLAMRSLHGQADRLLALLDEARAAGVEVTADLYPYTYWQSTLMSVFPGRDLSDLRAAQFVVDELSSPEEMLIPFFAPDPRLAGKTVADIAALRGTDPAQTLLDLLREAEAMRAAKGTDVEGELIENVIAVSMDERDIERLMSWPFISFCTDGELDGAHPRGYGSFTRVLGRYVRERRVLSVEDAVHKMTGQAAANLGIEDRGRIAPGAYADLVLFDPATVLDRATPEQPHSTSIGIEMVWVNGRPVWQEGQPSERKPGMVLRRQPVS
jgi:N-acyl-D-aspartate/D-glutamate deacylase